MSKAMALILVVLLITLSQAQDEERKTKKKKVKPFGDEARLLGGMLKGYEKAVRPVANASHTIVVKVSFALTQILDMDEKNQVLTTNVWFSQEWRDEKLVWEPSEYNGLHKIRIPPDLLWRPDIVLYNGVDDYGDKVYSQCLAMVSNNGTVFWAPIANLRSTCKLDLTFFPFDDQICLFKMGSWTYDGFQVDLMNMSAEVDLNQYTLNGAWDILGTKTCRNVVYYPCCPEPFPDVTFTFYLRRRTLYYILNIVVPCLILSFLSMLGFWLPVGTSEKVSLGLTVLLAFYVLGLSIADRIPETSEFVPLVGIYLMVIMILSSISVAMCVFILHVHSLGAKCVRVPLCLHRFVTRYLARAVGMRYLVRQHEVQLRQHMEDGDCDCDCEERKPLRIECEDLNARYKLIQVEGSGLYILAREGDSTPLEKDDKEEINDLHRVKEKGKVLRAMKAIMVSNPQSHETHTVEDQALMWHDIAEVMDRFFFWLTFSTLSIATVSLLVIMPLTKPDPLLSTKSGCMDGQ